MYQQRLAARGPRPAARGMACPTSRPGNCWDNAVAESFFATLKSELVYLRRFQTRQEVKTEIFEYLEGFYNRQRRHSTLGYLSPVEFEERTGVSHTSCPLNGTIIWPIVFWMVINWPLVRNSRPVYK